MMEYKTIELFGKMVFEKVKFQSPQILERSMPDDACFFYMINGSTRTNAENDSVAVNTDESILLKCGNFSFKLNVLSDDNTFEAIVIHFNLDLLKKVYESELPMFLKRNSINYHSNIAKIGVSTLISKYIESLLFYFENPFLINDEIKILKLKEIILLLYQTENAPRLKEILHNLFSKRTFEFKEIIQAHLYTGISINELAVLTNSSLSTFKRRFKNIYQDNPSNYFLSARIKKAKELLQLSDQSIASIAFDCGFKNLSHFNKVFKEKTNTTPSEVRLNSTAK